MNNSRPQDHLITIADTNEIVEGKCKSVFVHGRYVVVFNVGGQFYAFEDKCSHGAAPLSNGSLCGTELTCPYHGARFEITTGQVLSPPATRDITRYPVQIDGNEIKIDCS